MATHNNQFDASFNPPWIVLTNMMICPWEVSQINLVCLTPPLCRPQCLAARARKVQYFFVWRIVRLLCNKVLSIITVSTFVKKTKGKYPLKGHQARQKIAKEVGKSGYYQPVTSQTGTVLGGYTDSVMSASSTRKLEGSVRKANGEAAARDTPGKGTLMGNMGEASSHSKASSDEG
jgi:hypothetical protein